MHTYTHENIWVTCTKVQKATVSFVYVCTFAQYFLRNPINRLYYSISTHTRKHLTVTCTKSNRKCCVCLYMRHAPVSLHGDNESLADGTFYCISTVYFLIVLPFVSFKNSNRPHKVFSSEVNANALLATSYKVGNVFSCFLLEISIKSISWFTISDLVLMLSEFIRK